MLSPDGDHSEHVHAGANKVSRYADMSLLSGQRIKHSECDWRGRCRNYWGGYSCNLCGKWLWQLSVSYSTFAFRFSRGVWTLCSLSRMWTCQNTVSLSGGLNFYFCLRLCLSLGTKQIYFFIRVVFAFLVWCDIFEAFARWSIINTRSQIFYLWRVTNKSLKH